MDTNFPKKYLEAYKGKSLKDLPVRPNVEMSSKTSQKHTKDPWIKNLEKPNINMHGTG